MESWAMDEARQRLARWAEESRAVAELVPLVLEEQSRLRVAAEAAEVECVRLRQELTALRAETEALRRDRSEVADLIANSLSRLSGEALRRLRERPTEDASGPVEYRRARILLVDDEPHFTGFVAEYL